jgi:Flp pilus assembly protein TadB
MMEDQALILYVVAFFGATAIVLAFYLAMKKLNATQERLERAHESLRSVTFELERFRGDVKARARRAYNHGFSAGFKSGVAAKDGDKSFFEKADDLNNEQFK